MSTLDQNLKYSKEACSYILKLKKMEGANWDQYRGSETSYEDCLSKGTWETCKSLKGAVDICLYDKVRPQSRLKRRSLKTPTMINQMRVVSDEATANLCGNCAEFSIVAFVYLYDRQVRPLDWVSVKSGDHAFLIIGRKPGDINDSSSWGADAAICDPWAQGFRSGDIASGAYPAAEIKEKMEGLIGSFNGVNKLHREANSSGF